MRYKGRTVVVGLLPAQVRGNPTCETSLDDDCDFRPIAKYANALYGLDYSTTSPSPALNSGAVVASTLCVAISTVWTLCHTQFGAHPVDVVAVGSERRLPSALQKGLTLRATVSNVFNKHTVKEQQLGRCRKPPSQRPLF